ncbi:MAG: hypothetical protein N2746_08480, partial [Deltaproteobacteria bacterium]|nr:hypothetical protein [Deltaproteobacteria bacterium]
MFISFEKSLIFRGLKFLLYVIVAFVSLEIRVYAQKEVKPEELFYNYLSQKFQEKKLPENISKKVWNYLSDPSKGYKSAGLSSEEFASIVRDYSMSVFSKRIVEFCLEVLKIDTRENLSDEKKRENLMKYIKHVERLADAFNLSVINLQNKYLVVYSDGEQPPLGIVGKIKT